jgi:hypothetical protein
MEKEIACEKCGSVYELSFTKTIMCDQDSLPCEICGQLLHRWREAKIWEAKLIHKKENHLGNT